MRPFTRRARLAPGEMFPAGDPEYRVSFTRLRSGLRVRVVERGDADAAPVLFLHGWGASLYCWHRTLPAIARAGFRAIAVDLKGAGLSDTPTGEEEYSSASMVGHVIDILDALSLESPVVVGHSLGAALGLRLAGRHPNRLRAMVLLAPVGHAGVRYMRLYRLLTPRFFRSALPALWRRAATKLALRRVYGGLANFTERDVDEYWAPSQFADYAIAQRDLLHAFDWRQTVEPVRGLPALCILGTRDHLVRSTEISRITGAVPQLELQVIEGAGHIIPEETPGVVNAAIVDFLRRCVARS